MLTKFQIRFPHNYKDPATFLSIPGIEIVQPKSKSQLSRGHDITHDLDQRFKTLPTGPLHGSGELPDSVEGVRTGGSDHMKEYPQAAPILGLLLARERLLQLLIVF